MTESEKRDTREREKKKNDARASHIKTSKVNNFLDERSPSVNNTITNSRSN